MTYREIYKELKRIKNDPKNWDTVQSDEGDEYQSNFLGSYMSLDPCGRYHNFLSPNGVQKKCERYWENMDTACDKLGMWLSAGEGDLCDIFLNKPINN